MVVAVRVSPPVKGKVPKLNMLELVSVANNRYKISKLRKRLVPEGYCYVCSRINPSGIISKSNGYLFKKGFLHTCEHFPKAPYTTFVQEEIPIQDDDGGDSLVDFAIDKTETISVTIRKGSRSTAQTSEPKVGEKLETSLINSENDQKTYTEKEGKYNQSDFSAGKFRLPLLGNDSEGIFSARSEPNKFTARKLNRFRKPSGAQTGLTRKSIFKSESVYTGSEPSSVRDRIAAKEAGTNHLSARTSLNEDVFSTKSARENDFDSMYDYKQSATSVTSGARLPETRGLFINQSDGLQNAFSLEPLIREEIMIAEVREPARRLKARFKHERKLQGKHAPSEHSASSHRPDSAHLRYHHRATDDSVPDPGFEIPPTPDATTGNGTEQREQDNGTSRGDPNDTTGSGDRKRKDGRKDGGVAESTSEKNAKSAPLSGVSSDRKSFCRCATDMREVSFTRNICKTCGKDCKFRNSLSRGSSFTYSQTGDSSIASRSGRFRSGRHFISEEEMDMYGKNARTTVAGIGRYTDQKFALNEEDDRYWSSDEEFPDFETSPVSWLRDNKPYPVLNPDIHKEVYLAALQAARLKGKQNPEDFEIDEMKMLRRPHVFSYIPLLPYKDTNKMKYIGIRPDNSSKPKKGQFMKHIFGDVQLDDFYPKLRPRKGGKIKADNSEKNLEQTTPTNSQDPDVPSGPERSSVSLKLKSRNN